MVFIESDLNSLKEILGPYKMAVETKIEESISNLGNSSPLRDACEYALRNGGKRFRPALVMMISKALGFGVDVNHAALGVEYFHTASLIADDLPCMDNDDERRDKPSLHKIYGESISILASYALIAAGYHSLVSNANVIRCGEFPFSSQSDHLCVLALENVTYNAGLFGAPYGQYLDLFPPNLSPEVLKEAIFKKTVSLFEISFVLGWIFGGGDSSKLDLVKRSAAHFGFAFQIADDLGDMAQDAINGRQVNWAAVCGVASAKKVFHEEITAYKQTMNQLNILSSELEVLADLLIGKVEKN